MATDNVTTVTKSLNYLKVLSIIVMLWFIAIFSVERLDIDGASLINFPNSMYIVTIIIGMLFLVFPNLQRLSFWLVYASIFGAELVLYALLNQSNFVSTTLAVQMGLHAVTLGLMRSLSINLHRVEEGIDTISLTEASSHILEYDEAMQLAKEEIFSLQQRQRPMAVVYCLLSSDDSDILNLPSSEDILNQNLNQMFEFRKRQVELGRYIMGLTHVGDIIFEYRNGIVVCLLESNEDDAKKFMYRLHRFVHHFQQLTLWVGQAIYPNDSLSIENLLQVATNTLAVYETEEDQGLGESPITGDVRVGFEERLNIEIASDWVNKLAHQSATSRSIYQPIKRAMDVLGSGLILLLISPLVGGVALLIYLNDGRPIFFKQTRVGIGGKGFAMYKFRSMYRDAKPLEPVIVELPDGTIREDYPEKTEDDPRITPIGRFIRKWSVDELPQLWNVFKGDMSLIGPRPSSWGLEKHTLLQTARLTVKPGITGLWQVSARDNKNFDERLLWDLKYVQKMSLSLDLLILVRTFAAVLRKTGV